MCVPWVDPYLHLSTKYNPTATLWVVQSKFHYSSIYTKFKQILLCKFGIWQMATRNWNDNSMDMTVVVFKQLHCSGKSAQYAVEEKV